jgi:hypothetical protein
MDYPLKDDDEPVGFKLRPAALYTPKASSYQIMLEYNDLIGNGTRDLPSCWNYGYKIFLFWHVTGKVIKLLVIIPCSEMKINEELLERKVVATV